MENNCNQENTKNYLYLIDLSKIPEEELRKQYVDYSSFIANKENIQEDESIEKI